MAASRSAVAGLVGDAHVFAALGDPTRLRIVIRLCDGGPASIVRLTDGAKVSRQAITKHLRALERAGLVRSGRAGRERIWELQGNRLAEVRRRLDQISDHWDAALERLRALLEDEKPTRISRPSPGSARAARPRR
jgi:DNA-binding transcriptional ArsR family regulator